MKDRTEEFQDWFLLQSPCRLEHRGPSRRSSDPEERKWANWIHAVRYASCIRAGNISMQIDCILQSCGCVRKVHKRLFRDNGTFYCSTPYEDLPLQHRKIYNSIRPFVKGPSMCQGWNYDGGIGPCNNPPVPGSNFCAKCAKKNGGLDYDKWSAEEHGRIMLDLRARLQQIWATLTGRYSRIREC